MNFQPGCRFAIAPRFHLPVDWPRRLRVGSGVEDNNGFFPRGPWRAPTDDELAHLIGNADSTSAQEPNGLVELFRLPEHLRSEWWKLLERAVAIMEGRLPNYDAFVARVVSFLAFKGLPIPEGATCDAVVNRPGQRSIRCNAKSGRPLGMNCSLYPRTPWPVSEVARTPRLWGGINLGDEATSLVLINLTCAQMNSATSLPIQSAATIGELTEQFLRAFPDYPPIRMPLEPGEGFRLPRGGLVVDISAEGKQEADILLLITEHRSAIEQPLSSDRAVSGRPVSRRV